MAGNQGLELTGSSSRNSLAFFCRDMPEETHRANSAKNGTGSKGSNVAEVNFPVTAAFNTARISAERERDFRIATRSVISRIHTALRARCTGEVSSPTFCRHNKEGKSIPAAFARECQPQCLWLA